MTEVIAAHDFALFLLRISASVAPGGRVYVRPSSFMAKVALVVDDSMLIRYTVCRFWSNAVSRWRPPPMEWMRWMFLVACGRI